MKMKRSMTYSAHNMGMGQKKPGIGPQVKSSLFPIYQGNPFWGYPSFDPHHEVPPNMVQESKTPCSVLDRSLKCGPIFRGCGWEGLKQQTQGRLSHHHQGNLLQFGCVFAQGSLEAEATPKRVSDFELREFPDVKRKSFGSVVFYGTPQNGGVIVGSPSTHQPQRVLSKKDEPPISSFKTWNFGLSSRASRTAPIPHPPPPEEEEEEKGVLASQIQTIGGRGSAV